MEEAYTASLTLMQLISDILDVSKIEQGRVIIESIPFSLRDILDNTVSMFVNQAKTKGIDLYPIVKKELPDQLIGDPTRLRQVIVNLMSNAVKFTKKGEVTLYVEGYHLENDERLELEIMVKDTGIGISSEKLTMLFEPFTQADASTTRQYGGTGLGLNISKNLVELMGGKMTVNSRLGEGSEFKFSLPLMVGDPTRSSSHEFASIRDKRVLIVDDNVKNRKVVRGYLDKHIDNIRECDGCDQAITELLKSVDTGAPFDLIISDYQMPRMNGIQLAQVVQAIPVLKETPYVIMSSSNDKGEIEAFGKEKVSAVILKPLRRKQFIHTVYDLLTDVSTYVNLDTADTDRSDIGIERNQLKNKPMRILLAEDNHTNQKLFAKYMEKIGIHCTVVENGREACDAMRHENFDMVFMDCQMPLMDGYEATKRIRKLEKTDLRTPIIALTANAFESDKEKCLKAGMDDYLSKPIDYEKLNSLINERRHAVRAQPVFKELLAAEEIKDDAHSTSVNDMPAFMREAMESLHKATSIEMEELEHMYSDFSIEIKKEITQIQEHLKTFDFNEIKRNAHKLKGSTGNLQLHRLYDQVLLLEDAAKRRELKACFDAVGRMERMMNRL